MIVHAVRVEQAAPLDCIRFEFQVWSLEFRV